MAGLKEKIKGHDRVWNRMVQAIDSENQSGSFLFTGPEGIGKKKVAMALAQYFLCLTENGCGFCNSCKRVASESKTKEGSESSDYLGHEGLLFLEPQNNIIKIDQAERVKEFLRLRALSKKRFIIINEAHRMNLSFANAILKTLEEPTEGVIFILLTHSLKSILTTIKSRSRVIRFHSLSEDEVKTVTQEWAYTSENFIYRGQLHLIKNLMEEEGQKTLLQTLKFIKELFLNPHLFSETEWRFFYKDKSQFMDFMSLAPLILRDVLVLKQDVDSFSLILPDNKKETLELVKVSVEKIFLINDFFRKTAKEMGWSPDPIFLLEKLICDLNQNKSKPIQNRDHG